VQKTTTRVGRTTKTRARVEARRGDMLILSGENWVFWHFEVATIAYLYTFEP
jgi:hypothetical protein